MSFRLSIVQQPLAWQDAAANRAHFASVLAPLAGNTDLVILPEMFTTRLPLRKRYWIPADEGFLAESAPGAAPAAALFAICGTEVRAYDEGGAIAWRLELRDYPDVSQYGYVSFDAVYRPDTNVCGYARTVVTSERAQPLSLWLGGGGAVRAWWNGERVIDDSAYSRQNITRMLGTSPLVEVVGVARDGEEALRKTFELQPDLVTLDLEMPRMDGFTFLRLVMAKRPTPVMVISGRAGEEDVFKALELGAVDFIAKPSPRAGPELASIERELIRKVHAIRELRIEKVRERLASLPAVAPASRATGAPVRRIAVIGSSTGGPAALMQLFRLAKALMQLGRDKQPLAWTVLTRGAQRVLPADLPNPDHAAVHGLAGCIASRVRGWQFPAAGGPTTVNVPFVFAAQ